MAKKRTKEEFGPVIACGAATVSLSRDPDDPTSFNSIVDAIKRFMKNERPASSDTLSHGSSADHPSAPARGTAL